MRQYPQITDGEGLDTGLLMTAARLGGDCCQTVGAMTVREGSDRFTTTEWTDLVRVTVGDWPVAVDEDNKQLVTVRDWDGLFVVGRDW